MYFPEHKLAIEVNKKGDKDRDKPKEIERQKAIEKELDCEFIRINLHEKDLRRDIEIGKIYNYYIQLYAIIQLYKYTILLPPFITIIIFRIYIIFY